MSRYNVTLVLCLVYGRVGNGDSVVLLVEMVNVKNGSASIMIKAISSIISPICCTYTMTVSVSLSIDIWRILIAQKATSSFAP